MEDYDSSSSLPPEGDNDDTTRRRGKRRNEPGTAGRVDERALLAGISRAIRSAKVATDLRPYQGVEAQTGGGGSGAAGAAHPDAQAVLQECRRRHPERNEFVAATIAAAYRQVLRDRRECAIEERLSRETRETRDRVLESLMVHLGVGDANVLRQVWRELVKLHPDNLSLTYSQAQARAALRIVRSTNRSRATVGTGAIHSESASIRWRALGALANALGLDASTLLGLDFGAYTEIASRLPVEVRQAVKAWIKIRGEGRGLLFCGAPPRQPREQTPDDPKVVNECPARGVDDPTRACGDADWVRALCRGEPAIVGDFLLGELLSGGHWSDEAIAVAARHAGCTIKDGERPKCRELSKDQRSRCRARLRGRWHRLDPSVGEDGEP